MARPEYFINPTGAVAKGLWNTGKRGVQSATEKIAKRIRPKRSSSQGFGTTNPKITAVYNPTVDPVFAHMSRLENGGWQKLKGMHKRFGYEGRSYYGWDPYEGGYEVDYLASSPSISVYSPEYNFNYTGSNSPKDLM